MLKKNLKRHMFKKKWIAGCPGYAGFGRISEFLCGYFYYAVTRIISFLNLPLFAKIPLILPNLSHFSLTIGFTFVISLAIQSIRSICESLFITLIIFLRILPTNAQLFCYITYIFLLFCVNYRFISGYNGINDCTENFNIFVDL